MPTEQATVRASRLTGIEALRGCAASAVVLYHAARQINHEVAIPDLVAATRFGHAGVNLFFVLSGFIIFFAHQRDIGDAHRLGRYAMRRFKRVMPTYWVALALTLVLTLAGGHGWPPLSRLFWSASLLPSSQPPLLGVAWTLQFELVFYAIFGTLIFRRRPGIGLMACWFVVILARAGLQWHPTNPILAMATNFVNLEFFMGMGASAWLLYGRIWRPRILLYAGILGFVASAVCEGLDIINGYGPLGGLCYGLSSMLMIMGIAGLQRQATSIVRGVILRLGAASYSIYLFQFIFMGVVWKLAQHHLGARHSFIAALYFALVAAALLGGIAASDFIEKPLVRLRWPQSRSIA